MKKIIILAAAFAMLQAGDAHSQNFINKMKQKAENAVTQRIGGLMGNNSQQEKIDITDEATGDNSPVKTELITDFEYDREQVASHSGAFNIDLDNVRPASGNTYEQLLAQLPALPQAAQIVEPTESAYVDYFKKLQAVKLRIEQLQEDGCNVSMPSMHQQNQALQQRPKDPMASLTPEEIRILQTEGESLEKELNAYEKKAGHELSDIERFVYVRKNHSKLLNVLLKMNESSNGVSAARTLQMVEGLEAEQKAKGRELTKAEMDAYATKNFPDVVAQATAAQSKQAAREQAANQVMNEMESQRKASQKLVELDSKLRRDDQKVMDECDKFAIQYEGKLRDTYRQIINSADKAQTEQLYAKADAMVSDYKKSASQVWLSSIKENIDLIKSSIPEILKLKAVNDECVANMVKLEYLHNIITDMEDAYAKFPDINVEPLQVSKTDIKCYRYESVFYPKVTGFKANSRFSSDGSNLNDKYTCSKVKPAYGTYKSANGKRVATFSTDGILTIPGCRDHYPVAFEQQGDILVWYEFDGDSQNILEYKYKL